MKRRSMTWLFSIRALSLAVCFWGHHACATTLTDALALAYTNSEEIRIARERLKSADEEYFRAFAQGYLPSVTANAARNWVQQKSARDTALIHDTVDQRSVQLQQSLFKSGGTTLDMERAKHAIASLRATLDRTEQDVLLEAIKAYANVQLTERLVHIQKENVKANQTHLKAAEQRFLLGEVTRADVAQTKSNLAQAQANLIDAEGRASGAIANYERYFASKPEQLVTPHIPSLPPHYDDALQAALKHHPSIIEADEAALSARRRVDLAKTELLPSINLLGSVNDTGNVSRLDNQTRRTEWQAGLRLEVPIYQSGVEYSRVRGYRNDYDGAQYQTVLAREQLLNKFRSDWENFLAVVGNRESLKMAIDSQKLALEGLEAEVASGLRTTLDLLSTQQRLNEIEVKHAGALRDEVVQAYAVQSNLGQLTARSLNLPSGLLYDPEEHFKETRFRLLGFGGVNKSTQ